MMRACCGQVARRATLARDERLPANRRPRDGVRLLYLGAGRRDLVGAQTGTVYVVSDHRRQFLAAEGDVPALLRDRTVILRP